MIVSFVLAVLAVLLGLFWLYFSWNFDYWSKRGVPSCNPYLPYGDRGSGLPFGKPFWMIVDPLYQKYKGKGHSFVGTFQARRPVLVALEPEIVKMVLTKEFASFHSRGQPIDEEGDPMSANLFNLDGPRWKNLRSKLSPTFTSGKLKLMFPLMADISRQLNVYLKDKAAAKEEMEFKDLLLRYSTDVIGSVAFGIDCNSLKCEENEFFNMSREVFRRNFLFIIRFILVSVHPIFVKLMPMKNMFQRTNSFFLRLMKETVEHREASKIERNDFVNLMMQLRESDRHELDRVNHIEFNHNIMAAQAFLFFIAGLDSIANTVGFAMHELALNPELQARAAEEVRDCIANHKGMTYEAVKNMGLIERIIRESLRKYGPVGILFREPTESFKMPDSDVVVDKSILVWIPVWQMHRDPEYFPDPERFDPERFTEEAKEQRHPYVYLPFGEGPRFCIAERFAILEMKLCLASLLQDFQLSVGSKTDVACELDPKVFSPTPKKGFWLRIEDRA